MFYYMKTKYKVLIVLLISLIIALKLVIYNFTFLKKTYIVIFHKSGVIAHFNSNGKLDGEVDTYVNGKITQKANLKNGLFDGWTADYYPNGVIKDMSYFKNNKIEGVEFNYYNSGKIKSKESFVDGKYEGPKIAYYQNGQIEQRSFRKNDKVNGTEYAYYEDGNLKYTRNWVDDKPYGDFYYYYDTIGKKVKFYHAYDVLGDKFYLDRYDKSRSEGFVFSSNIYSKDKDSVIVLANNGKYKSIRDLFIDLANPPYISTAIKLTINDKLCKDLNFINNNNNNTVKITNAFLNKGIYKLVIDGRFVDKSNMITNGTTLKITVIKE